MRQWLVIMIIKGCELKSQGEMLYNCFVFHVILFYGKLERNREVFQMVKILHSKNTKGTGLVGILSF